MTETQFMKHAKPLIITALVAGNLLAWDLVLPAQEATNTPPPPPPAGGPPPRPPGGPGMRGRSNFDPMAQQLALTEDQKPKFRSIMESRMQKMRDLRQDPQFGSLAPEERRAKVQAIQDETTAQVKALLTPEQFEKYQKLPQMGMRGRQMGPPPGAPKAVNTNAPAASAKTPQK